MQSICTMPGAEGLWEGKRRNPAFSLSQSPRGLHRLGAEAAKLPSQGTSGSRQPRLLSCGCRRGAGLPLRPWCHRGPALETWPRLLRSRGTALEARTAPGSPLGMARWQFQCGMVPGLQGPCRVCGVVFSQLHLILSCGQREGSSAVGSSGRPPLPDSALTAMPGLGSGRSRSPLRACVRAHVRWRLASDGAICSDSCLLRGECSKLVTSLSFSQHILPCGCHGFRSAEEQVDTGHPGPALCVSLRVTWAFAVVSHAALLHCSQGCLAQSGFLCLVPWGRFLPGGGPSKQSCFLLRI